MCAPFFFLPLSCFSAVLAGPMVIGAYQRDPNQSTAHLVTRTVGRATAGMLLIVILSLVEVNFFFGRGQALLPTLETSIWAVVLCATAAASAAALLGLVSRLSVAAAKWGFRGMILAVVLIYRELPLRWTYFWYDQVDDWGLSRIVFGGWLLLVTIASIAYVLLHRRRVVSA